LMQGRACRWCHSTVPLIEHQLHESLCGCHDEPCSVCSRRVMRSMADAHIASGCDLHASEAAAAVNVADGGDGHDDDNVAVMTKAKSTPSAATTTTATATATATAAAAAVTRDDSDTTAGEPVAVDDELNCSALDADAAALLAALSARRAAGPAAPQQARGAQRQAGYGAQKCSHCGESMSAMLMEEHNRLCAFVRSAASKSRPFSRGAPLPAVGAPTPVAGASSSRYDSLPTASGAPGAAQPSPSPLVAALRSPTERRLSPVRTTAAASPSSSSSLSSTPKRRSGGLFAPLNASERSFASSQSRVPPASTAAVRDRSSQRAGQRVAVSTRHQLS
jgi:hypothetical protein